MIVNYGRSPMHRLAEASDEFQQELVWKMSPIEALHWDADFESWANKNQLPPHGEGWRVWLMMAGRGFGKTRAGSEWIHRLATGKPGVRIALVGATMHEGRSVMVEGVSGLLRVAKLHGSQLNWEPSLGRLRWRNGSQAQVFSGEIQMDCAGRNMTSPGRTNWPNGPSPRRPGPICRWVCGAEAGRVR
jgi:phage terminase large subunit-like protein